MTDTEVKEYFDKITYEFDNIYDNRGHFLNRIINMLFRKGLYERVPLTIQECGELYNKTVLDIGCGSGRVSFILAKKGANVTGIDYSVNMITLAKKYKQNFINHNLNFVCCDFIKNFDKYKQYDISIALGVFDYIQNPMPFLRKMKNVTKERMIASYPAKYTIQMIIRKIWLYLRRCPVYFYTEKNLEKMYSSIGIKKIKIIKIPRNARIITGYLVIAE